MDPTLLGAGVRPRIGVRPKTVQGQFSISCVGGDASTVPASGKAEIEAANVESLGVNVA